MMKGVLYEIFLLCIKISECNSVNSNVVLNRAKDYYENDKEILRDNARDKYINLSEGEKNVKREYGKNRYHNMSEETKQRLVSI